MLQLRVRPRRHDDGQHLAGRIPLAETEHPGEDQPPAAGDDRARVERTIEQDPAFAVRIILDVAVKALSAAINDPTTTAVQAIDHLASVLALLGSTSLHGPVTFRDPGGAPRLLLPGRTWKDYFTLGVTEIREYGSTSIQVMRRLRVNRRLV